MDELRSRIAVRLQDAFTEWDGRNGGASPSRVFVEVSPSRHLTVTVVSAMFETMDFDGREEAFWSLMDQGFSEAELGCIDFWQMLTPGEAMRFYPTFLGDRLAISHS
jgi:hypothetical protein